jgi:hypothetical protein
MTIKVLAVSDIEFDNISSSRASARFGDIKMVLGCGDLSYSYLEYLMDILNCPLLYVRGNHANPVEYTSIGPVTEPRGGINIHRRVVQINGIILAGVEGSLRYRPAPYQYTQSEMWWHVFHLVPKLLYNRLGHGRYLDIFISHAPPWGIHDQPDLPHQGIKAFRWLLNVFRPSYHFHGHIHIYQSDTVRETQYLDSKVINAYGFSEVEIKPVVLRNTRSSISTRKPQLPTAKS